MRPHHTRSAGTATFVFHPSYANPTAIIEGTTTTYYIQTTGVSNGTTLYWSITHGTTTNADFSANSGVFTISNNFGQINISPIEDGVFEAVETFTLNIRTESTSGLVVLSRNITVDNAPTFATITGPDYLTEGQVYTYTVTTTGIGNNTYLYFHIGSGASDVAINGWNGVYIYNGSGTFEIYVEKNDGFDTPESFYMYITYNNQIISDYEYRTISTDIEEPEWNPTGVYAFYYGFCYNYGMYTHCQLGYNNHNNVLLDYSYAGCYYQEILQNRDNPEFIKTAITNWTSGLRILGWFNGSNWIPSVGITFGVPECYNRYLTQYDGPENYYLNTCCDCSSWFDCWYNCHEC